MTKIVVFGGNGFIGQHLVRSLANKKTNNIFVFDRFRTFQSDLNLPFDDLVNVTAIHGDFLNRDEVHDVLKGANYVFHLISTTNPALSQNDPLIDIDTNIRGSVELFQHCVEQKIEKVIFFSSGGTVYGNIDNKKIGEDSTPRPVSPYGIGKLTIEHYLRYFKSTHNLDYVIYRIANPYGPGQNIYGKQGVIPIFMHHFINKEPLTIYGDGSMMRDYIYIDDLISMIVGSYDKKNSKETYNLGSGKGVSVNELIESIEKCSGYSIGSKHLETPPTYVKNSVLDISAFTKDFGIEPSIGLNEGIERTWNYVKKLSK